MKILNIDDYVLPDSGYQINILPKYLKKFGHETYILTTKVEGIDRPAARFFGTEDIEARDALYEKQTGVKIVRVKPLLKKLISGRLIQGRELYKKVKEINPDIIFVHGNDTITGISFLSKRKDRYPLVTDSHMLKMASTNRFSKYFQKFYKKFITPKIIKKQIPVIRTQDDDYVESALGIPLSQAPWISYGTDTQLFRPDQAVKKQFREEHGIPQDAFVFVYTGKMDEAKGGKFLAEAFKQKFNTQKQVVFIAVGSVSGEYGKDVEKIFGESENKIIRFETQKYNDLAKFYQVADVCVFAKQCSLSFYDAQGCALPVISEDNNINVDRNSHGNGLCFESGNVESFREKLEEILNMPDSGFKEMSQNALKFITENYNYEDKAREYEQIILNTYNRFKEKK